MAGEIPWEQEQTLIKSYLRGLGRRLSLSSMPDPRDPGVFGGLPAELERKTGITEATFNQACLLWTIRLIQEGNLEIARGILQPIASAVSELVNCQDWVTLTNVGTEPAKPYYIGNSNLASGDISILAAAQPYCTVLTAIPAIEYPGPTATRKFYPPQLVILKQSSASSGSTVKAINICLTPNGTEVMETVKASSQHDALGLSNIISRISHPFFGITANSKPCIQQGGTAVVVTPGNYVNFLGAPELMVMAERQ